MEGEGEFSAFEELGADDAKTAASRRAAAMLLGVLGPGWSESEPGIFVPPTESDRRPETPIRS